MLERTLFNWFIVSFFGCCSLACDGAADPWGSLDDDQGTQIASHLSPSAASSLGWEPAADGEVGQLRLRLEPLSGVLRVEDEQTSEALAAAAPLGFSAGRPAGSTTWQERMPALSWTGAHEQVEWDVGAFDWTDDEWNAPATDLPKVVDVALTAEQKLELKARVENTLGLAWDLLTSSVDHGRASAEVSEGQAPGRIDVRLDEEGVVTIDARTPTIIEGKVEVWVFEFTRWDLHTGTWEVNFVVIVIVVQAQPVEEKSFIEKAWDITCKAASAVGKLIRDLF